MCRDIKGHAKSLFKWSAGAYLAWCTTVKTLDFLKAGKSVVLTSASTGVTIVAMGLVYNMSEMTGRLLRKYNEDPHQVKAEYIIKEFFSSAVYLTFITIGALGTEAVLVNLDSDMKELPKEIISILMGLITAISMRFVFEEKVLPKMTCCIKSTVACTTGIGACASAIGNGISKCFSSLFRCVRSCCSSKKATAMADQENGW